MTAEVRTTCPYCGVGCGVIAKADVDGSFTVRGDPDHPANFGRLCSKGSALGETGGLDGRLLYPEIGGVRTSWDSALDLMAEKFGAAIREHGPDSVGFYVSGQILTEDYYAANKLMKGFIGSSNIDTNSRLCMASSVAGHRRAFGTDTVPGTYSDLETADLIILTGSNLLWCHPVLYQRIAAAKAARPSMKVALIDPRRTRTAALADLHLDIEPDSDSALFSGLLTYLHAHGATKPAWVAAHTDGFDEALEAASRWTVSAVARTCGLSAGEVETFYRLFADNEKTVTCYSQGVNQSSIGTDKVNAIINCHLATARIGREGMGPFSLTGQPNAMGGRETGGLANMLAAHMDLDNERHGEIVRTYWNAPRLSTKPGLKAVDLFQAAAEGRIKALWIMATNPVVSMPDRQMIEKALKTCPFVVVSDCVARNDTMPFADVLLPSLGWGEKEGTVTNSERRISRQRAFVPAPGEARADWWQMAELGRRLGFGDAFDWPDAASIFREYAGLTAFRNAGTRDLDLGALEAISDSNYDALPPFQWPQANTFDPAQETRFFADGNFFTPDRKGRFVPVAVPDVSAVKRTGLRLNTGRVRDHWHTMTRTGRSARLSAHMAEPYCEIHPEDAVRLGLKEAGLARLQARGYEAILRVLISPDQRPGSVFAPMHWNSATSSGGAINGLVAPLTDPFSGQPALKGSTVALGEAGLAFHGFAVSARKPETAGLDYWALARTQGGWRLEFALKDAPGDFARFAAHLICNDAPHLEAQDPRLGLQRYAAFAGTVLAGAVFLGRGPVAVSRSWVAGELTREQISLSGRWRILAGRAAVDAGSVDKGAIVCACRSVGINQINAAIVAGCRSVLAVGEATDAGTQCGSCRPEIMEAINAHHRTAAE